MIVALPEEGRQAVREAEGSGRNLGCVLRDEWKRFSVTELDTNPEIEAVLDEPEDGQFLSYESALTDCSASDIREIAEELCRTPP